MVDTKRAVRKASLVDQITVVRGDVRHWRIYRKHKRRFGEKLYEERTEDSNFSRFVEQVHKINIQLNVSKAKSVNIFKRLQVAILMSTKVIRDSLNIKLPQLKILIFDRDPESCMEFWSCFCLTADSLYFPAVRKFTYLLSRLESRTHAVIAVITITEDDYNDTIQMFMRRLCVRNKKALYQQFTNIPYAGLRLSDFKHTVGMINKIYNQLGTYAEDTNHPTMMFLIQEELPPRTLIKYEEVKLRTKDWTSSAIRNKSLN